jgi:hypothetical protein
MYVYSMTIVCRNNAPMRTGGLYYTASNPISGAPAGATGLVHITIVKAWGGARFSSSRRVAKFRSDICGTTPEVCELCSQHHGNAQRSGARRSATMFDGCPPVDLSSAQWGARPACGKSEANSQISIASHIYSTGAQLASVHWGRCTHITQDADNNSCCMTTVRI